MQVLNHSSFQVRLLKNNGAVSWGQKHATLYKGAVTNVITHLVFNNIFGLREGSRSCICDLFLAKSF